MYKFSRTLYNRQLIQFARIHVEFVVRSRRYESCVKVVITYPWLHGIRFKYRRTLMFTRSQSTMFSAVHSMRFITASMEY